MKVKRIDERAKNRLVFLCSYIEDILILLGLVSIIVASYMIDVIVGLFAQGLILMWLGFIISKILK